MFNKYHRYVLAACLATGVAVATVPASAPAQTTGDAPVARSAGDAPLTAADHNRGFGWIGLLGLIGLAGLMRRPQRDDHLTTRTTPTSR